MAEGIELAKAYVQIIPSTKGFEGKLESEMESAGGSSANTFAKGFGGAGKAMGAIAAAAVATAGAAAVKLAKDAVSSYANYEQLVGGVEKLYGDAADKLMDFADAAYATAGMSANQYMETATSFSAALINSLGGDVDKAADMTDVAMKAISDNVNVFGSDMGSVTNAFQGFAKQNYTMLDNLKLGYGGTQSEMERLIQDAEEFDSTFKATRDEAGNIAMSFADVVSAIQIVQEKQNIAGTTAKEAMFTIEGAATATKSAWANVITAIGRGEGIEDAMSGLTASLFGGENGGGLLAQIIPRIQTVLQGIAGFITQAAPIIAEQLPIIVETLLPPLASAATNIIVALIPAIIETLPVLIGAVAEAIPELLGAIGEALVVIWNNWVGPALDAIGVFFVDIWKSVVDFFTPAVKWVSDKVITPLKNFFTGLWKGIVNAWNTVIGPWIEIAKRLWEKIREGAAAAWEGIKNIWNVVSGWFTEKIVDPIKNFFTGMWEGLKEGASQAWEGIKAVFQPITDWFKNIFKKAWEGVKNVFSTGGKIFSGIKEGLEKTFKSVVNAIIRGINTVVALPFNAINKTLDTLRRISILGVSPFSWLGSIGVPQIPLLAKGGVLTGPTLMMGGEHGAEAVVPLERNTEWIRAVAVEMDEAANNSEVVVLEDILEKLDNMRIYLDTGKLVGGISGRMDGALGDNAGMRQRGVALA